MKTFLVVLILFFMTAAGYCAEHIQLLQLNIRSDNDMQGPGEVKIIWELTNTAKQNVDVFSAPASRRIVDNKGAIISDWTDRDKLNLSAKPRVTLKPGASVKGKIVVWNTLNQRNQGHSVKTILGFWIVPNDGKNVAVLREFISNTLRINRIYP